MSAAMLDVPRESTATCASASATTVAPRLAAAAAATCTAIAVGATEAAAANADDAGPSDPTAAASAGTAAAATSAAGTAASNAAAAAAAGTLAAIAVGLGRLTALVGEAAAWPTAERRAVLRQLDRVVDGASAVRAAVLLAERESGAWQGGGDRSFEAWRARTALAGERAAAAQVRQAEHLAAVPTVVAAVAEGRIGLDHAATIGRVAATGTPAQQAAVTSAAAQSRLMQLAEEQDAGTFATTVAGIAATVDPDGLERDHQAQRRARFLHLSHTTRGTLIKGLVDAMAGHRLQLALEALSPRPGADDDRDPGQRRADALDTMVGRVLCDADTKPGAHVPPHVSMILTEATWHAARAERVRRRQAGTRTVTGQGASTRTTTTTGASAVTRARTGTGAPAGAGASTGTDTYTGTDTGSGSGSGTGTSTGTGGCSSTVQGSAPPVGYQPATLEDGTPVPPSELARVMCDCDVTRLVVDADEVPLDLGRTQRLFTGPQRRAVIARDRQCAWPSCHAPARWCEIHHIEWWDRDGGRTAVDRGVLLCSFHHHEVHRRDLAITRLIEPPGHVNDGGGHRRGGDGPGVRPAATLARARYEFRDRGGRVIGELPAPAQTGREPPDVPRRSGGSSHSDPREEPAPGWTVNPVTGMSVPSFFMDR